MKHDPIVEEIHQIRQKMLAECDGNLTQLLDQLQAAEAQDYDRLVSLESLLRSFIVCSSVGSKAGRIGQSLAISAA